MLADQAGWHVSQDLKVPENMRLIKLPPRSPELNPAEHIWEELREKNFANRAFRDLDEVEDHLCQGLNDRAKVDDNEVENEGCDGVQVLTVLGMSGTGAVTEWPTVP